MYRYLELRDGKNKADGSQIHRSAGRGTVPRSQLAAAYQGGTSIGSDRGSQQTIVQKSEKPEKPKNRKFRFFIARRYMYQYTEHSLIDLYSALGLCATLQEWHYQSEAQELGTR